MDKRQLSIQTSILDDNQKYESSIFDLLIRSYKKALEQELIELIIIEDSGKAIMFVDHVEFQAWFENRYQQLELA